MVTTSGCKHSLSLWAPALLTSLVATLSAAPANAQYGVNLTSRIGGELRGFASVVSVSRRTAVCNPGDDPLGPACSEVIDGCLEANKETRILKFGSSSVNDGLDDGSGVGVFHPPPEPAEPGPNDTPATYPNNNPVYVWFWSHHHFHLRDYGVYTLLNARSKALVSNGQKFSFNVPDLEPGEDDVYYPGQPCQFIRVDGLPDGEYNLVSSINASSSIPEVRRFDNASAVRIRITGDTGWATNLPPTWDGSVTPVVHTTRVLQPPVVVSRGIGAYDLFYTGSDGKLRRSQQSAVTGDWSTKNDAPAEVIDNPNLPYAVIGRPAALARSATTLDLFARTTTNSIYTFHGDGTTWSYYEIGDSAATAPAAVATDRFRMMVAWLDPAGTLTYLYRPLLSWGEQLTLPGTFPLDQTPVLVASGSGTIHLFLRTSSGSVRYNRFTHGSGWAGWVDLGGSVIGQVAAASSYLNRVDLFARASDNRLLRNTWNGSSFSGWINDGGEANLDSAPTVISTGPKSLDVFFFYRDGGAETYRHRHLASTTWTAEDVGDLAFAARTVPMAAASWASNTLDIFMVQIDGSLLARSLR